MRITIVVPIVVASTIILITVGSGPIGIFEVDQTDPGFEQAGTGTATVEIDDIPDKATLRLLADGQHTYQLDVPASPVSVSELSGNPILIYQIHIEEYTFSAKAVYPLAPLGEGTHKLTLPASILGTDQIDTPTADGSITVVLHDDSGEKVLHTKNLTIEVQE